MLSASIFILLLLIPISINADSTQMVIERFQDNYINLTAEEAWDLLTNTSNGIQYPIDVRTTSEWEEERIDTPFPEFPRHIPKDDIVDNMIYQEFLEQYDGEDVVLYCKSGGRSSYCANILISRGFNGTVYNILGGISSWKMNSYPTKIGNMAPDIPTMIDHPTICNLKQEYNFTAQTSDFNEDPVRFGWDFNGDMIVDEWSDYVTPSSISTVTHSFDVVENFEISVLAQDIVGETTVFTDSIVITTNTAPNPPTIQGQLNGKAGKSYEYSIVSTDSEGDEISYLINWGDDKTEGWTRTKPSGEELIASHEWDEKSEYTIKVKAKDIYDAESNWATLDVKMPKNQVQNLYRFTYLNLFFHFIQKIIEK